MKKRTKHNAVWLRYLIIPAMAGMLLCAFADNAQAQKQTSGFFSAAYLHELCKRDSKGKETVPGGHTACQAYISGVIDYHKLMKSLGTAPIIDFCVPNTEPMKKLQDIVWVYLARHSEHKDFIAAPAVTLALYDYYPCPKKAKARKR
jgi:hypothetical protein